MATTACRALRRGSTGGISGVAGRAPVASARFTILPELSEISNTWFSITHSDAPLRRDVRSQSDNLRYPNDPVHLATVPVVARTPKPAKARASATGSVVPEFVSTFGSVLTEAGMPTMSARTLALLMISEPGAMTAAELQQGLGASQGTVSAAVNYLIRLGYVSRHRIPRTRKDIYRFRDDVWHEVQRHRVAGMGDWISTLESTAAQLPASSPAAARLQDAAAFMRFLREDAEGLMARWRSHQTRHR